MRRFPSFLALCPTDLIVTLHREIKPLKQISIRGSGPLREGGAGFLAKRDAEGKVQSVEADGVRVLVGEDVSEGCLQ